VLLQQRVMLNSINQIKKEVLYFFAFMGACLKLRLLFMEISFTRKRYGMLCEFGWVVFNGFVVRFGGIEGK